MPAGDLMDRDSALLHALNAGSIPVFFCGFGRGDLMREALSRTLFGVADADTWSVLIKPGDGSFELDAAMMMVDSDCRALRHTSPTNCSQMSTMEAADELVKILRAVPLSRQVKMRSFIIDSMPARNIIVDRTNDTVISDMVVRLVSAMLFSESNVTHSRETQLGNRIGSPLSWPVH